MNKKSTYVQTYQKNVPNTTKNKTVEITPPPRPPRSRGHSCASPIAASRVEREPAWKDDEKGPFFCGFTYKMVRVPSPGQQNRTIAARFFVCITFGTYRDCTKVCSGMQATHIQYVQFYHCYCTGTDFYPTCM